MPEPRERTERSARPRHAAMVPEGTERSSSTATVVRAPAPSVPSSIHPTHRQQTSYGLAQPPQPGQQSTAQVGDQPSTAEMKTLQAIKELLRNHEFLKNRETMADEAKYVRTLRYIYDSASNARHRYKSLHESLRERAVSVPNAAYEGYHKRYGDGSPANVSLKHFAPLKDPMMRDCLDLENTSDELIHFAAIDEKYRNTIIVLAKIRQEAVLQNVLVENEICRLQPKDDGTSLAKLKIWLRAARDFQDNTEPVGLHKPRFTESDFRDGAIYVQILYRDYLHDYAVCRQKLEHDYWGSEIKRSEIKLYNPEELLPKPVQAIPNLFAVSEDDLTKMELKTVVQDPWPKVLEDRFDSAETFLIYFQQNFRRSLARSAKDLLEMQNKYYKLCADYAKLKKATEAERADEAKKAKAEEAEAQVQSKAEGKKPEKQAAKKPEAQQKSRGAEGSKHGSKKPDRC
ncbi:hypothetical protein LTR37_019026 [Vermiconidia calcicola]|uniref:Uncharacterized protein n=1 Tax=Vermiconidia calcicola TaxID=1690605 RepID=A0ACC3MGE2_9PEZI|nr:hypothetical protein LTR37_019026 [Vermiconidia calcicola]